MADRSKYSSVQLACAKVIVVLAASIAVGLRVETQASKRVSIVFGVVLVISGSALIYEMAARGLARLFAMRFGRAPVVPAAGADAAASEPEAPALPTIPSLKQLVIVSAWFLGANLLVWIVVGLVAAGRVGPHPSEVVLTTAMVGLAPAALPLSVVASGLALLLALRAWRKQIGAEALANLAAAGPGTGRQLVLGLLVGGAVVLAYLGLAAVVKFKPDGPPGLLVQIASSSPAGRWAWAVSALLLAPPIEEAFFRGALLGGLLRLWGPIAATLVSGVLFWALHGSEWIYFWPAAVGIGALTAATTALRLRTRAIGPAIAAHFAYNAALVVMVMR